MSTTTLLSLLLLLLLASSTTAASAAAARPLLAEYIGAEFNNIKFTDIPINPNVDVHLLLSFAIDYTASTTNPTPTNGHFLPFWDTDNLSPSQALLIKTKHPNNVKLALSLGGDSITEKSIPVNFHANSVQSWVNNAVNSLTPIIQKYHIDGIDIDYEHFKSNPSVFADCIGQLITRLKTSKIISFASIAPYEDDDDQGHFLALWAKYGDVIDYVNYQFYSMDKGTSVLRFLERFDNLSSQYKGGKLLASFGTDDSGGLKPAGGFFKACQTLKSQGKLRGIAIWSADDSKKMGFAYEKQAQILLAA